MRALFAWLLMIVPTIAESAAPPVPSSIVKLDGAVKAPASYSIADLEALPSATIAIPGHDSVSGSWKGVPLISLINKSGTVEKASRGAYLQHVIIAQGSDGYGIAIAIGEIEPQFEGKQAIVAYEKDGSPLSSLRLIIPGDAHAGRDVRDLTELTVK